eukprot:TRINITY_DN9915_c0_g1_i3.p1 TRINITY_DN9915_c0_g1~~TRINITY_DN9915_c0_g1_i3.p1  ORF type:complete len:114 (+),score=15.95 TRINITY_DN9915_c0_g1_i3:702-1043(+)
MHSVNNIRSCLEELCRSGGKEMVRRLKRSVKRSLGGLTREEMRRVRVEVDSQLGIKPATVARTAGVYLMKASRKTATKYGIMNSLINLNGKMTEFSNTIRKSVRTPEISRRMY